MVVPDMVVPDMVVPDSEWRCDNCGKSIYWYRFERSRVKAMYRPDWSVSICLDCWPKVADKYEFVGLTTLKGQGFAETSPLGQ